MKRKNKLTRLSPKEQAQQMDELQRNERKMMDYCYANKDEFKLILCSSDGTKYENIIHDMAEIEVDVNAGQALQNNGNTGSPVRNTMLTKHLSIYWQADSFLAFEVIFTIFTKMRQNILRSLCAVLYCRLKNYGILTYIF